MAKEFSEYVKEAVWNKARIVPGYNSSELRQDIAGAWIKKSEYGNRDSRWGWEIDHIKPESLLGSDHPDNLQPLQWENNVSKGDDFPAWWTAVSSVGETYVKSTRRIS